MESVLRHPDRVIVITEDGEAVLEGGEGVSFKDIKVSFARAEHGLGITLEASATPVKYVGCRWSFDLAGGRRGLKLLGDAWERAYGDLEWRGIVPERVMPFYFLISDGDETAAYGVRVRPNAICFWQADSSGVTLWLDVRSGGRGVCLGGQTLEAATVVYQKTAGISAFAAQKSFCRAMCSDPLLPPCPVYGSNNWYYAYGDSSHSEILGDAELIAELTAGLKNRPFMVIDDGWQVLYNDKDRFDGGPWHRGNGKFPDMRALADGIKERGVRPGIWIRFLYDNGDKVREEWRSERDRGYLDPTAPGVLEYISESVSGLVDWGYELIKHDFSTADLFGKFGFRMYPSVAQDGWGLKNNSITSAQALIKLYDTVLKSARGELVIGCNCIGHLGAGLMHIHRSGEDTSGKDWERTRKYGVNTLAFRLAQNRAFYVTDADCVGIMGHIPWSMNKKWAGLLARSGTPLFTSAKPGVLTDAEKAEIRELFRINSVQSDTCEPLDWMDTLCPAEWNINGENVHIDWYKDTGVKIL